MEEEENAVYGHRHLCPIGSERESKRKSEERSIPPTHSRPEETLPGLLVLSHTNSDRRNRLSYKIFDEELVRHWVRREENKTNHSKTSTKDSCGLNAGCEVCIVFEKVTVDTKMNC